MPCYGPYAMILGFSVNSSTAAVHTKDTGLNVIFFHSMYISESDKH